MQLTNVQRTKEWQVSSFVMYVMPTMQLCIHAISFICGFLERCIESISMTVDHPHSISFVPTSPANTRRRYNVDTTLYQRRDV